MLDKCFVESDGTLKLQKLGIIVREGHIDITVDAFSLDCTVIKSAYAKLSGRTIFSRVLAHQRSVYDGSELEASEGKVHVPDQAKTSIWFEEELEFGLFGRSKMDYKGKPWMKILQIDERCTLKQTHATYTEETKNS